MKKLLMVFTLAVTFLLPTPALAEINFKEVNTDPYSNLNWLEYSNKENVYNSTAVINEVYRLAGNLRILDNVDWSVYMINQSAFNSKLGWIGGYYYNNSIAIFDSPDDPAAEYYIDHEIGHLSRFNFITDEELAEYIAMRNDGKEHLNYFDKPEELFAEDFRWLFGTPSIPLNKLSYWYKDYAPYLPTYAEPSEKEKEWIHSKLQPK